MRGYIMSVTGFAILAGLLSQLLPADKRTAGYVRLASGLCLLLVMLLPLSDFLGALPDLFENGISHFEENGEEATEYERLLAGTVKDAVRSELAAALREKLHKDFGIDGENVEIGISFEEGEPLRLRRVLVTLRGKEIFRDPYQIENALTALLGCECAVVIG